MRLILALGLLICAIHGTHCRRSPVDEFMGHIEQYCSGQQVGITTTVPMVNYDIVNSHINEKFQDLHSSVTMKLTEIKDKSHQHEVDIAELQAGLQALRKETNTLRGLLIWHKASNGHFYKFFNTRKPWQQAKVACQEHGAILVSAGARDARVLKELQVIARSEATWIGLSDIVTEGRWMWEDGTRYTTGDLVWNPNEPNDNEGKEDCALLLPGTWNGNDGTCNSWFAYICEKSL